LKLPGRYDAVLVSVPAALGPTASEPLATLTMALSPCPIVSFRDCLGQHASVGATAAALAGRAVVQGCLPFALPPIPLPHRRLLLLDVGPHTTAIEVYA